MINIIMMKKKHMMKCLVCCSITTVLLCWINTLVRVIMTFVDGATPLRTLLI